MNAKIEFLIFLFKSSFIIKTQVYIVQTHVTLGLTGCQNLIDWNILTIHRCLTLVLRSVVSCSEMIIAYGEGEIIPFAVGVIQTESAFDSIPVKPATPILIQDNLGLSSCILGYTRRSQNCGCRKAGIGIDKYIYSKVPVSDI